MYSHYTKRPDAVTIGYGRDARDFVPTIYGQPEGNTVWVSDWRGFRAAGGIAHFNEDQTEITLTLPERHKFGIRFTDGLDAPLEALRAAERFIAGFEGDELQDGIAELLAKIRAWLPTEADDDGADEVDRLIAEGERAVDEAFYGTR